MKKFQKENKSNLIYYFKVLEMDWKMVNIGKNHLLTIITLKNGNIFGGYSPCQLNREIANYVADNTNSSFVF